MGMIVVYPTMPMVHGRPTLYSTLPSGDYCFADGTSWHEIDPAFFQPSLNSHVLGWYVIRGS